LENLSYNIIIDELPKITLIEKEDSIVWGYPDFYDDYQLLRIPKKDKDILMRGKDQAISFFISPPPGIKNELSKMFDGLKQLYQEREELLEELERSLYCQCFSGDCRYLGSPSS
jgi:hypothetical protein